MLTLTGISNKSKCRIRALYLFVDVHGQEHARLETG